MRSRIQCEKTARPIIQAQICCRRQPCRLQTTQYRSAAKIDQIMRHGKTVRIRVKIRVKHAACRETFDHAQLLNAEQNQRRPDVIEKLNRDEQNPERNLVSLSSARKRNAVMSDKHLRRNCRAFVSNANVRRFTETPYKNCLLLPIEIQPFSICS